jgi:hypothetical protein
MKTFLLISLLLAIIVPGQVTPLKECLNSEKPGITGSKIQGLEADDILAEGVNPFFASVTGSSVPACPVNPQQYYEWLFYTCKAWGFVKYFHSQTANCSINLDSVLIDKLPLIELATTNDEFNGVLLDLILAPGETALPTTPPPVIPDSLRYNLDLGWIQSGVFSQPVKDALDTIRVRFRPRQHCLVGGSSSSPSFDNDIMYNNTGEYPDKPIRLLALFRYWNILNYFFPYKNIMDQDWDSTLVEVLPLFAGAQSATDYTLAELVLTKRINDSHALTYGGMINILYGAMYPRFSVSYVENETVITRVHNSIMEVKPGDIIRNIDGVDIEVLRDSIEKYTWGSNDLAIMANVHTDILRGPAGPFDITIENENGITQHTLLRDWNSTAYYNFMENTGPIWYDTLVNQMCHYGYVDMSRLTTDEVEHMMLALWDTDAMVFDIRNYPNNTLWTLVDYLFPGSIHIASFTVMDVMYPGVLSWMDTYIGTGTPNPYEGKLIILFDIRTISQAEYTCMGLEQHPGSLKIGSQTRAADGNVSLILLPGYLNTNFTGLGTFYPDRTPTQRIGIVPDIEVWPTIEGIRQGKDEVLEVAMDCYVGAETRVRQQTELRIQPNPFTGTLRLEYLLPHPAWVTLEILNLWGQPVAKPVDKAQEAGHFSVDLDGTDLPAGVYCCRLAIGGKVTVKKIIKVH